MNNSPKKLYRSKKEKILAGVAGGLAEYFGIEPLLVRVAFIILSLFQGVGILLYLILMILLPEEQGQENPDFDRKEKIEEFADEIGQRSRLFAEDVKQEFERAEGKTWWSEKRNIFGAFLVLIGVLFLLEEFFPVKILRFGVIFAIALIFIGSKIIFKGKKQ